MVKGEISQTVEGKGKILDGEKEERKEEDVRKEREKENKSSEDRTWSAVPDALRVADATENSR